MANLNRKVVRTARQHGLHVLTRRQWGSTLGWVYAWRRIFRRHKLLFRHPSDTLVQHITVTRSTGNDRESFKQDMLTLERIGQARFKSGISYNFGWDMQTGMIGVGQPLQCKGTHTLNDKNVPGYSFDQNAVAIAIAAIGMPGDKPSDEAVDRLSKFIGVLIAENVLTETFDYDPHSKFAYKDCPTDAVRNIMPQVRRHALRFARSIKR